VTVITLSVSRLTYFDWGDHITRRDRVHEFICEKLGVTQTELTLAQVLEAATWKGGREIAKEKRPGGGREF